MTTTIIIGALVGVMVGVIVWLVLKNKQVAPASDNQGFVLLQNQMSELKNSVSNSLRVQSSESNRIIRDIVQELTKVGEGQKQVLNFADQLRDLQDILKNPKQRGILGEYYLETLLKNVLPAGSYQMQYPFPDGTIVDAAVFVKDKIIPIDSKFSLENYNRIIEEKNPVEKEKREKLFVSDLKNRITETSKYIQPGQGTMDFAFMFIPHEAIYYDLIVNKIGALKEDSETLIQRAASKYHVLIVSPTSFLAYLQTVLQGLNALHIEEKAVEIIKRVEELGRHLKSYEEYYGKLGNSLSTTINHYNSGYKELCKVDKDVLRITGTGAGLEPLTLDKPSVE